jgi:hypothetical protein
MTNTPASSVSSGRAYAESLKSAVTLAEQHHEVLLEALNDDELSTVTHALNSLLGKFQQKQAQRRLRGQDARESVLTNSQLLIRILSWLVEGAPGSAATRKTLGLCALVSQSWKSASRVDLLWRPILINLLPAAAEALRKEQPPPSITRTGNEYALSFIRYGNLVAERKKSMVDIQAEFAQLIMHMEIFDSGDQFHYLSAVGRMRLRKDNIGNYVLNVLDEPSTCCTTNAFSVATRDPGQERYATIQEYFHRAHEADSPARLCMRIVASHRGTSKSVMLLEVKPKCQELQGDGVERYIQNKPPRPLLAIRGPAPELIDAYPCFLIGPVVGQSAEISEREKMWRIKTSSIGFVIGGSMDSFYKSLLPLLVAG